MAKKPVKTAAKPVRAETPVEVPAPVQVPVEDGQGGRRR